MTALLLLLTLLVASVAPLRPQSGSSSIRALEKRMAALEAENARLANELKVLKRAGTQKGSAPPAAPAATAPESTGRSGASALLGSEGAALDLDRPIAAVPAFTALDLSPESVAQPANPRDFTAALLNGVDREGVLQTGVAIEVTPFRWIPGWKQDFPHYNRDNWGGYWTRFFYNASLSLATAKASGDEDEKAINLALGLQFVLWQDRESDPLRSQGYRLYHRHVLSPYLWSFSNHYTSGKYVADGTWSDTARSAQCGAAVLLRRMAELGTIEFEDQPAPKPDDAPVVVRYATRKPTDADVLRAAEDLQRWLNTIPGIWVKVDGVTGQLTSDAYRKVTGKYLPGDPRG